MSTVPPPPTTPASTWKIDFPIDSRQVGRTIYRNKGLWDLEYEFSVVSLIVQGQGNLILAPPRLGIGRQWAAQNWLKNHVTIQIIGLRDLPKLK